MKAYRASLALILALCALSFFVGRYSHVNAAGNVPRDANGHPDMSGIWEVMNTANYDIEPHDARAALAMRPGPIVPVPAKEVLALGAVGSVPAGLGVVEGDEIPYTPEARKKQQYNKEHWLELDPEIKCYLPGVPRATYMPFPFQIFQGTQALLIAYEYDGAARSILYKDPGPPPDQSWMGQSVGHWEGGTFVVEVRGFNDQTWLDRSGNFHSDKLHVQERYTMTSKDVIQYEATLTDPEVYTRPMVLKMNLYRRLDKDARLLQFKCVEFVEELIYGKLRRHPLK